ncbi:TonB-dependent receptor [Methylotenera sp. N17]|jgi:outer membrane receptor protein involved in Fe transport|uniref:TonB-dependent receptor n=1 Tax=Methylotenera sp. N17 TaxID=1502761 RepID=UPI000B09B5A1|nr:TonB-dependent receptor [Methylotenera sp. N17]
MFSLLPVPRNIFLLCALAAALATQVMAEEKQPNQNNPQVNKADPKPSTTESKPSNVKPTGVNEKTIVLDKVEVKAKKSRIVTPLPGLIIDRGLSTTNIQSASGKEIAESRALNVTEFMNSQLQSVTVNDYNGNPFQQDLNFRGFTASPSIGTPQGISVYLDGVRVNEAFGEVVNWDMIPMNAIASLDLIPGSNPMFGLNTLGGALALRTKNGFTDAHLRAQLLGGAWGREQMQFSNGFNVGNFGFFTAYNHFEEDGWRDNSPSNVRQLYNAATIRLPLGEINFSVLNANSSLTGNGMLPFEMADVDRSSVFTSPDGVKNELAHYNLNGRLDVSDHMSISALAYRRNLHQQAVGADIYDSYRALQSQWGGPDADGDGVDDVGTLNGLFNLSESKQTLKGSALQFTWETEEHQIAAGANLDETRIKFMQSQALGVVDADHNVTLTTDPYFQSVRRVETSFPGIVRNNLTGSSRSKSIFFSDTWSPVDNWHITYGARYNWTNVKNRLLSDRGNDLYNFNLEPLLLNGNRNPRSNTRCTFAGSSDPFARFICSTGDYDYRSFNPSIGVAWEPQEDLTVYGNVSRGARTPTVIELGCAKDDKGTEGNSTNFQYGCNIPTALSADPYLKQVRSTSYETGMRGGQDAFSWNVGLFRTELKNDILFIPLGRKNRGVFDNFGQTLRQGVEMGMKGEFGNSKLALNYTFMRATFESPSQLINNANSTNTSAVTGQAYVNVKPGDQLPGMPNHIVQANWNYRFTDRFDATLGMVMHSFSYVRGNENNKHRPRAALNVDVASPGNPLDGSPDRDVYDYIGDGKISGYATFNLKANYKFDHGVTLFVKVDNLFNKNYATAGDLGLNPFSAQGTFQYGGGAGPREDSAWNNTTFIGPGAPRAAWLGLEFDLDWKKIKQSQTGKSQ